MAAFLSSKFIRTGVTMTVETPDGPCDVVEGHFGKPDRLVYAIRLPNNSYQTMAEKNIRCFLAAKDGILSALDQKEAKQKRVKLVREVAEFVKSRLDDGFTLEQIQQVAQRKGMDAKILGEVMHAARA